MSTLTPVTIVSLGAMRRVVGQEVLTIRGSDLHDYAVSCGPGKDPVELGFKYWTISYRIKSGVEVHVTTRRSWYDAYQTSCQYDVLGIL